MRSRGGGSGSAPRPVCGEDAAAQDNKAENWEALLPERSDHAGGVVCDAAPEEQRVHNVIPLKDKMPPLSLSDVQAKQRAA